MKKVALILKVIGKSFIMFTHPHDVEGSSVYHHLDGNWDKAVQLSGLQQYRYWRTLFKYK